MGVLRVLEKGGEVAVSWEDVAVAAGRIESAGAMAVRHAERLIAEDVFERARARGGTAYLLEDGQPAIIIERFDPTARLIIIGFFVIIGFLVIFA